jgi:aspartyl-tRNA(Asn)/glutamyl-tRNA(Gln) amidotransferase subunit A
MKYNSLKAIQKDLLSGVVSAEQVVLHYLKNIESTKHLNAYIEVYAEEAVNAAKALDDKIKMRPDSLGKLFGCVVSVKDIIVQKNRMVSAGSKILSGFESQFSATCLKAMAAEDAIIIGRTNCDEFGMGSANTNSYFGPVKNGADNSKVSGGSSGGAAVSVQTDTCLIALGTDTGGSVRQPASMCGVYGFKPTYGLVSRYGLIAYASSFDQAGILAHNSEDIAAVMSVISIHDDYDATMFRQGLYPEQTGKLSEKLKIAYLDEAIHNDALAPEIRIATLEYLTKLTSEGHQVDKIHFELLDYLVPCYYILTTAEASSNLSRYDGVRYGHRTPFAQNPDDMYIRSRTEGFGPEVKKRIMLGAFVLSEAHYDAYYTKAQQVRQLIKSRINRIFETYDFIILPVTPSVAWSVHERPTDPLQMYMADIYTVLANLAGIPGISIPLGNNSDNLPFGIQLLCNQKDDKKLLNLAVKFSLA